VQFKVLGSLPNLYQCHCSLCRRQSGAASNAATIVPVAQFFWLAGEQLIKRWQKPSGMSSHFCGECGSPVPNVLSGHSCLVWVPAGLLGKVESKVVAHLCWASRADWDLSVGDGLVVYEGMPPDLMEFVRFLSD